MDPIFCKALLGISDAVVSVDACAGAMAALQAAEIQAKAAHFAGWLTLGAGICAIFAALVAYNAQLKSANIQIRLIEKQELYRQKAVLRGFLVYIERITTEMQKVGLLLVGSKFEDKIMFSSNLSYTMLNMANPPAVNFSLLKFAENIEVEVNAFYNELSLAVNTTIFLDIFVTNYEMFREQETDYAGFKDSSIEAVKTCLKMGRELQDRITDGFTRDIEA